MPDGEVKPMNTMCKRMLCISLILTLLLGTLGGCKKQEEEKDEASSFVVSSVVSIPITKDQPLNPLTGEHDILDTSVGKRPIAVMINNIKKAWPQCGIGSADVMYEIEVEGGITRMMAVFASDDRLPEKLGSVRSCRPYFLNLAGGHDAIYVGHGWSSTTKNLLSNQKVMDYINGVVHGSAVYRDAEKRAQKGLEHSSYTSKELLQKFISSKKMRDTVTDERRNKTFLTFRDPDMPQAVGAPCDTLTVPFSSYATSVFSYDKTAKTYAKSEFSKEHIDEASGKPLVFTNVFVLFLPSGMEDKQHLTFSFDGGGTGFYASNGAIQPIKWQKGKNYTDSFTFTDENGQPMAVNAGKSMICLVKNTRTDKVKYTGAAADGSTSSQ